MWMRESELKLVTAVTAEVLHADAARLRIRNRFIEDLGADSLELFEILTILEERCRVSFDRAALERVRTIGDAADLLYEVEHIG